MGDDIDKAGREFVVAILQDLKEGLKPYVLPIAATGVIGAIKFTKGAYDLVKSKCSTPEERAALDAVQAAAAARPSPTLIHGDDLGAIPRPVRPVGRDMV